MQSHIPWRKIVAHTIFNKSLLQINILQKQLYIRIGRGILYNSVYKHFELHLSTKNKLMHSKDILMFKFPGNAFSAQFSFIFLSLF